MKKMTALILAMAFLFVVWLLMTENANAPEKLEGSSVDSPIVIASPKQNETITSPYAVSGEARGTWYFEASFPVQVLDKNGTVIWQGPIQAKGDWMTENFVPFGGTVEFSAALAGENGTVVFKKDNPSGLPENDAEVRIPIVFGAPKETSVFSVFFGKTEEGTDPCGQVFSATRVVSKTPTLARAAIENLLLGPTDEEKKNGFFTSINPGVKVQKLSVENGVAKIDFDSVIEKGVGGSCRVSSIRAQIERTLLQFPTVKSVVISVDGRTEDILQP